IAFVNLSVPFSSAFLTKKRFDFLSFLPPLRFLSCRTRLSECSNSLK
ncbi:unnamed protein product, partial [Larinioides sclopetarius]